MTLGEAYRRGRRVLERAGVESPGFDADCLFRKSFGLDRQSRVMKSGETAPQEQARRYEDMAAERAAGRPLQYILGKWPFFGMELCVGEGVLIPREETELLVSTAAELLRGAENPKIADLCAGTGAVGLGLASLFPGARVAAVERYEDAFRYLERNIRETGFSNVEPVRLDVLLPESARRFPNLDAVVSNPPYVEAGDLPALQPEVRREPATALDGGADGLLFYRAIARYWLPNLKPGGVAAVEVGEHQAEAVAGLFRAAGIGSLRIPRDFNGIARVVAGVRQKG